MNERILHGKSRYPAEPMPTALSIDQDTPGSLPRLSDMWRQRLVRTNPRGNGAFRNLGFANSSPTPLHTATSNETHEAPQCTLPRARGGPHSPS